MEKIAPPAPALTDVSVGREEDLHLTGADQMRLFRATESQGREGVAHAKPSRDGRNRSESLLNQAPKALPQRQFPGCCPVSEKGGASACGSMPGRPPGGRPLIRRGSRSPPFRVLAARAIASLPQVVNTNDAVKQELAEAYLVQTALIGAHMDQAKGDAAQLKRVGAAVRRGAQASGLSLGAMELTDYGFIPG